MAAFGHATRARRLADKVAHALIRVAAAAAAIILSTSLADAASRHQQRSHRRAPAALPMQPQGQIYPNRPPWAAPWQCFTDEGYGRFRPCDAGGRGG